MFEKVEKKLKSLLRETIESYLQDVPAAEIPRPESQAHKASPTAAIDLAADLSLDIPKEKEFGDLSCTVALKLSRPLRRSPQAIAQALVDRLRPALTGDPDASGWIRAVEVKGPGFINFFLADPALRDLLRDVAAEGREFGHCAEKGRGKALIEFVSANPTGPLSVAHARQAAVGDSLANILAGRGYEVVREYYLNDEGNQIRILGRSILLRYEELQGQAVDFPPDHYQGQYIVDLARELLEDQVRRGKIEKLDLPQKEDFFMEFGVERILAVIRQELEDFGVRFDSWFSQKALTKAGKIEKALDFLKEKEFLYEAESALWFRSTAFGDDKDRVVRKSDGSYTYLAPDIAYHQDKFRRGFGLLINLWGPDHHGYIPRMKAAVRAMGQDAEALQVIIVQLATLFRQGEPVPMSTRKGQYVTLREVLSEVGLDAARYFFLMRKTDSHLDFDLELAKQQTPENPVYYVQYAHARIAGILAHAPQQAASADLTRLIEEEERDLMRAIFSFPYVLEICSRQLDPNNLTTYLQALAAAFHRFYDRHKVLTQDETLAQARLFLIRAVMTVLANGLRIMGVSAPDRM